MAQRPIWRGHLRLALVSCPVALYSAKHDRGSLHFNLINPDTGNRIRMITQDAETGQPLERKNLVKGYEFKKNTYVLLSDEDFQSVKVPSSSVMNIEKFVEAGTIDGFDHLLRNTRACARGHPRLAMPDRKLVMPSFGIEMRDRSPQSRPAGWPAAGPQVMPRLIMDRGIATKRCWPRCGRCWGDPNGRRATTPASSSGRWRSPTERMITRPPT
jgi:hypothetical protein